MVNGIPRFASRDENGDGYLATAPTDLTLTGHGQFEKVNQRDPGALVVDDFLTEEEEAKILDSLIDNSSTF